jgi:hypothetical protein
MELALVIDFSTAIRDETSLESLPRMPNCEALLARGDALDAPETTLEQSLLGMFGYDPATATPSAALLVLGEGIDPGGDYWLRADPVSLTPTRSHLTLSELPQQALTQAEAQALYGTLSAHFTASGCTLYTPHPQRWYLRLAEPAAIRTLPPAACVGVLRESDLPSGPDSAKWRRLITEVQMLLHAHPVSIERETTGKPPANAIWPWGGGHLPVKTGQPCYQHAWSDDLLVRALARGSGVALHALPRDANDLLAQRGEAINGLVFLRVTGANAAQALATLELSWFDTLLHALQDNRLGALTLTLKFASRTIVRRVTSKHSRRWWRRARPLRAYA